MSRAKKVVTHWTAHSCFAHGLGPFSNSRKDRALSESFISAAFRNPFLKASGAALFGCESRRRKPILGAADHAFSTDIDDITCEWCIERYAQLVAMWTRDKLGPPEIALVAAHRLCCAHRGAPLLADLDALRAYRDEQRRESLVADIELLVTSADMHARDHVRDECGRFLALLGEDARPAIAELLLAGEWMDQAAEAVERAKVLFAQLSDRIRSGDFDAAATKRVEQQRANADGAESRAA